MKTREAGNLELNVSIYAKTEKGKYQILIYFTIQRYTIHGGVPLNVSGIRSITKINFDKMCCFVLCFCGRISAEPG